MNQKGFSLNFAFASTEIGYDFKDNTQPILAILVAEGYDKLYNKVMIFLIDYFQWDTLYFVFHFYPTKAHQNLNSALFHLVLISKYLYERHGGHEVFTCSIQN